MLKKLIDLVKSLFAPSTPVQESPVVLVQEAVEVAKVEEVKKPKRGKPWFYIGDIPKGYREATEDEAIQAKKVSLYGKYQVDNEKWRLYKEYGILLTEDKTNQEITWTMNGLKKRTLEILEEMLVLEKKKFEDFLFIENSILNFESFEDNSLLDLFW
jgi:hypothetical protein